MFTALGLVIRGHKNASVSKPYNTNYNKH